MKRPTAQQAMNLCLCALTGVAVFLAYPGWNHHWLAWFAYVPLLVACRGASPKRAFWLGLFAGTITNAGGFYWMTQMLQDFGHLPVVVTWLILGLQAVTQGLAFAIGTALWRWLVDRGAPVALTAMLALWTGEVVTPMIFPWFLGNAISNETLFVQIAELGGVHVVSALLYASNAALFEIARLALGAKDKGYKTIIGTVIAVALTAAFGTWRIAEMTEREARAAKLKIGLVEGDIGIWEKQAQHLKGAERIRRLRNNLLIHQQMSAALEKQGAELIVWPESAYMPYGPVPVRYTVASFAAVGDGEAIGRHMGGSLVPVTGPKFAGEARKRSSFDGLSSPRGDVLRFISDGNKVLTIAPWHVHEIKAPKGEYLVDTASPDVDMFGVLGAGIIASRSGRVWTLPFTPEPLERDGPAVAPPHVLSEIPGHEVGAVEVNAVGRAGSGHTWLVGKAGATLQVLGNSVQRANSPTEADLYDVAGDPLGSELVAVGAQGTILHIHGGDVSLANQGGKHLRAVFFCQDGSAWAAGDDATLLRRAPRGRWRRAALRFEAGATGKRDIIAGACDADGNLMLSTGKTLWLRGPDASAAKVTGSGERRMTSVVGFATKASYTIPRSAKRVASSRAALPPPSQAFPDNVIADKRLGEFDRSAPRRGFKVPLLFGALTYGGVLPRRNNDCRACFNSAILIDGTGKIMELTDKAFLLVFGEYMPFGEHFPELYELLPESSRFQFGTRTRPLVLGNARIGVVVCYEDLLPRQVMKVAQHDPNVFVNLTNDAWFGETAEPEHHLQLAQLRSVEYRRWLVRSTNTGISVFIDSMGRRLKETKLTGAETLMMSVPLLEGRTLYAMWGDWAKLVLAIVMLLFGASAVRKGPTGRGRKKRTKLTKKRTSTAPTNKLKPQKL